MKHFCWFKTRCLYPLHFLDQNGAAYGIHHNINKCEVFWPSGNQQFTQFDHDIRRINVSSSGSEFLGLPIVGIDHFFDKISRLVLLKS